MIALVFAVSIVLRLARFNTLLDDDTVPAYTHDFFVGVPAPAGALICMVPIAALQQWGPGWWTNRYAVGAWMLVTAALVVSRVPTLAMKSMSVPPRMAALLLVGVALVAAGLITYPYIVLIVLVTVYVVHIPFAIHSKRWVAARPETWDFKPAERRAIRRSSDASNTRAVLRLGMRRPRRPRRPVRLAGRGRH